MADGGKLDASLADIARKLQLLEQKRVKLRQTGYFFTAASILLVVFFIYISWQAFTRIDTSAVIRRTAALSNHLATTVLRWPSPSLAWLRRNL